MNKDIILSIVLPCQDKMNLEPYINQILSYVPSLAHNYEIILVAEYTLSEQFECLLQKFAHIRLIRLSSDNCVIKLSLAGIDSSIGDYIVVLDPQTDPATLLPQFMKEAREHGYDIILGSENIEISKKSFTNICKRFFYWYIHYFIKINLNQSQTFTRLFSRTAMMAISKIPDRHLHYRYLHRLIGFKTKIISYDRLSSAPRSFFKRVRDGIDIILNNSPHPMRLISVFGLSLSFINLLYILYVIGVYLFKDQVIEGWTTLSLQVSGLFFLVMILLSVMSEYLGRVLEHTNKKPAYYIQDEKTSNVVFQSNHLNVVDSSESLIN